jgi:hypothetical protein
MLHIEEEKAQKLMKDLEQLELVLAKIPTKALYILQVNFTQEVHSRAKADATELEFSKDVKEMIQLTIERVQMEKEEEK